MCDIIYKHDSNLYLDNIEKIKFYAYGLFQFRGPCDLTPVQVAGRFFKLAKACHPSLFHTKKHTTETIDEAVHSFVALGVIFNILSSPAIKKQYDCTGYMAVTASPDQKANDPRSWLSYALGVWSALNLLQNHVDVSFLDCPEPSLSAGLIPLSRGPPQPSGVTLLSDMSMSVTNLAASNEEVRVYNSPFANLGAYDLTNMIKRPGNQMLSIFSPLSIDHNRSSASCISDVERGSHWSEQSLDNMMTDDILDDEGSGYHESFIDNSEDCLERPDLAGITRSSIDASNSMDNSSHSTFKSEKVHRSKTSPRRKAGSLMETMVDEAHERQRDRGRRMVQRLKKLTTAWENLDRKHGTKRKQLPTDEEFDRIQAQVEARREKNNNRKTWLFKSHDFAYLQEKK